MTTDIWRDRALAAERTVEVLKRKVVELYAGGGSTIVQTLERARTRELEAGRRQEQLAARTSELERYSSRLEAEVAARTHELQTILDNVVFGFLVIGRDAAIHGFTRSCIELLGRDRLDGEALGCALGYDAERRRQLELALAQIFDDVLSTELALAQLPRDALGGSHRALRLDGRVIRAVDGSVDYVLLTITDATDLQAAQRENAHYQLLVRLLRRREELAMFVDDLGALAREAREALGDGDEPRARRLVHTMKGNAGCFGLDVLEAVIHDVEAQPLACAAIDRIERGFAAFLEENADVLGMAGATEAGGAWVSAGELAALEAVRARPGAVATWITRVRRRPVRVLLAPLVALAHRLAERLDKRVALVIEGGELRVDVDVLAPVVRELAHLVRNAIDHGIEPAAERGDKPWPAHLAISVTETATGYALTVDDDGRGIDVERVVERALALGIDELALARSSREELLQLVFIDGLSTREAATEISGRGVGLSAVAAAVDRAGGEISLESCPGRGTRIEIQIARVRLSRDAGPLMGSPDGRYVRRGVEHARQGPHR